MFLIKHLLRHSPASIQRGEHIILGQWRYRNGNEPVAKIALGVEAVCWHPLNASVAWQGDTVCNQCRRNICGELPCAQER